LGTQLGGSTPSNDVLLTVYDVDNNGAVIDVFCQGIAPLGFSGGETFTAITGFNIESGTNAKFAVKRVNLGYFVTITGVGVGYQVGDQLVIAGSALGGVDVINDCTLTVTQAGALGQIQQISVQGTAAPGVQLYFDQTGVKQYGSGAVFDFVVASGEKTVFDSTSLRFVAPVDNYNTTDEFDKYIVFPKRTILT
jgi:hypothetical protein